VITRKRERSVRRTGGCSIRNAQAKAAVAVGVLFRQDLGHGGEESSSNVAPECARSDQRAGEGAAGQSIEVQAIRSVVLVDRVRLQKSTSGAWPVT
jgi:hypothetical protein